MRTADIGQQDVLIIYVAVIKYPKEMKEERVILLMIIQWVQSLFPWSQMLRQDSRTAEAGSRGELLTSWPTWKQREQTGN